MPVALPDTQLEGYEAEEEAVWGEVSFRVMFEQGLGAGQAATAAAGWGGDRYRVLWNGEDVAYALVYVGDTSEDAAEMYEALVAYATAVMNVGEPESNETNTSFVGDDYAYAAISGDRVLFVASSDPEAGPAVVAAFSDF